MSVAQTIDLASIGKLREKFRGQLILPADREYDARRVVWNAIADRYPALIARCTRVEDVMAAVRFAREHDLIIAVRGGGHSVAGISTWGARPGHRPLGGWGGWVETGQRDPAGRGRRPLG